MGRQCGKEGDEQAAQGAVNATPQIFALTLISAVWKGNVLIGKGLAHVPGK